MAARAAIVSRSGTEPDPHRFTLASVTSLPVRSRTRRPSSAHPTGRPSRTANCNSSARSRSLKRSLYVASWGFTYDLPVGVLTPTLNVVLCIHTRRGISPSHITTLDKVEAMTDPSKAEPRNHAVRWKAEDWERIEEAARIKGAEEHLDLTPTDIIRSGALRFVAEILAPNVVAPAHPRRRADDAA
jgi:hypothetical protein